MTVPKRKLIEVALPLEKINIQSARERSIRHGHPSTLHLWWSRKPLATARAVLFAQLVDDPSSHPDRFPTEEAVTVERKRLHRLIERLVVWENSGDEALLREAHEEILDSTGGNPPPILDPFAGGGTIPLEAQRLGLEAHASDLNPVAVLITKALIEIPPKFAGQPPVFPGSAESQLGNWPRAAGLSEDVRRYGEWMRNEAEKRIGHLYPKVKLPDGSEATVIGWIWARTVTCPNPACGISMPLTSKWWLRKKTGKEAYVVPNVANGKVYYSIGSQIEGVPLVQDYGTVSGRTGAVCIACKSHVPPIEVHRQLDHDSKPHPALMAIVADGHRNRTYLPPVEEHIRAASAGSVEAAALRVGDAYISAAARGTFGSNAQGRRYGFREFADYFTDRQLVALITLSDLVREVQGLVLQDALATGMDEGKPLEAGGHAAAAYADAIATYLGIATSRSTDYFSSLNSWSPTGEFVRNVFARQAIPITWDYVETNPFSTSTGNFQGQVEWIASSVVNLPASGTGSSVLSNAASVNFGKGLVSTDPPYYDNVSYSDLSDYFYVWLRRSLEHIHGKTFATLLTPKAQELVAHEYRHGGKDRAAAYFEEGFTSVFTRAHEGARDDFPITLYYAFKQSQTTFDGDASTGWETMLEGMIRSGWRITATWPMRSERGGRMTSISRNVLASSIVLTLRPRSESAPRVDRRGFLAALQSELPGALRELQQGAMAPVDLPQAAIGPGMAVFSRYSAVLEEDGSKMRVRTALARINDVLDQVLSEQEGDFDADTRFAVAWFRQLGFEPGSFGAADGLARARNASLEHIERAGILSSRAGKVTLLAPSTLPESWDPETDASLSAWEVVMHLARVLTAQGVPAASQLLRLVPASIDRDLCKELAFLIFALAEDAKRTKVAVEFNALGTAWNDIEAGSRTAGASTQREFDFWGE